MKIANRLRCAPVFTAPVFAVAALMVLIGCEVPESQWAPETGTGLSFRIMGIAGVANPDTDPVSILVEVPSRISVAGAKPEIAISPGATLSSDTAEPEFPGTVAYTVRAESGAAKSYEVTVVQMGTAGINFTEAGDLLFLEDTVSASKGATSVVYLVFLKPWGEAEPDTEFRRLSGTFNVSYPGRLNSLRWSGTIAGTSAQIDFTSGTDTTVNSGAATKTVGGSVSYETYQYDSVTRLYQLGTDAGTFIIRQGTQVLGAESGFEDYTWILDSNLIGRGRFLILNANGYANGRHNLTVYASRDGMYCSKEIALVIGN
jgi:hypothetical protein